MQKSFVAAFLSLLALPLAACLTGATTNFDACVVVAPDAGVDPTLVCDVVWSCNNDGSHYELACAFQSGNYACTCFTDGTAVKSFSVNPFTCDGPGALPAASSGCGWAITLQ
jgi:hypothetical protein